MSTEERKRQKVHVAAHVKGLDKTDRRLRKHKPHRTGGHNTQENRVFLFTSLTGQEGITRVMQTSLTGLPSQASQDRRA
jgi:hypothetical protein